MNQIMKMIWGSIMVILQITCAAPFTSDEIPQTDPNATNSTKALYKNLKDVAPKGVLFGHQDDLAYGVTWEKEQDRSDVKDVCGDYPAVYGWDIGWLGISEYNLDTVYFDDMKRWMLEAYKRGGINTVSWHINNLETGGGSWDKTPAVRHILPDSSKHEVYLQRLDAFADFAKSLKPGLFKKPIPIIFRPFHEHTGSWFWWGKGNCTAEEYKQLWRFTVEYLRDVKGVHNLLYTYSTDVVDSLDQYLEFYPGDDYVDIIGIDNYHFLKSPQTIDKSVAMLEMITDFAEEKNKVAALTETGLESIPMEDWFTNVLLKTIKNNEKTSKIAWVLVWRNDRPDHHYAPYKGHKSVPDFQKFYQDHFTIFESDLPKMYK